MVHAPGVLRVVEVAPLALARVRVRARVTVEERHVTEQERREAESTTRPPTRAVGIEVELTGPMAVARHPQVVRTTHVSAELEAVVALQLGEVADELPLLLVLIERAVAAVDIET